MQKQLADAEKANVGTTDRPIDRRMHATKNKDPRVQQLCPRALFSCILATIRGCVHLSVHPPVGPSVGHAFVKIAFSSIF